MLLGTASWYSMDCSLVLLLGLAFWYCFLVLLLGIVSLFFVLVFLLVMASG